jgi:choline monooxygenase
MVLRGARLRIRLGVDTAFSDEIQQEDIVICEQVQRGLRSRAYDSGRFSAKRENGVYHFQNLVREFLGEA